MTLHRRKYDDRTKVFNGKTPLPVPALWEIAPGDFFDISVCMNHPWQSNWLVFADGKSCGTAISYTGRGVDDNSKNLLIRTSEGFSAFHESADVLLRRRHV